MATPILYEVMVHLQIADEDSFCGYMMDVHVPEVYGTGCFERVSFQKLAPKIYRTMAQAISQDHLTRYLEKHAPFLREDFNKHFPTEKQVTREEWTIQKQWGL